MISKNSKARRYIPVNQTDSFVAFIQADLFQSNVAD